MKTTTINKRLFVISALLLVLGTCLFSCKKPDYPILVNGQPNITDYIESDPTDYSLFDQILQRTGYNGFLGAYGAYTLFLPTNTAIKAYLKTIGKSSVNDIPVDSLKNLVRYHVIQNDTISTSYFIDGKIRTPTLLKQYLTSGVVNINGVSSFIINGQALITQSNISCGNGVIQVIDHVLLPATKTLAQLLDANPKFTIFDAALKATGFYDTINVAASVNPDTARAYFTAFAESDSVYRTIGVNTLADLEAKYGTPGSNPLHNPGDSFYAYVGFHILPENSYLTDIISKASHITISPTQDIISDVLQNQTIQLCYDLVNGVQYPGASVDRPNSNIPSTNGVLHTMLGDIFIKQFPPTEVDWDLADQPEFRKQTSIFRVPGKSSVSLSTFANIAFPASGGVSYSCQASNNGTYYWWNDILATTEFRNAPAGHLGNIIFTTPIIIKGKYKVWFMYAHTSQNAAIQFLFDGQPLQNVLANENTILISGSLINATGPVLESQGLKRYTEAPYTATGNAFYNSTYGFYCGSVNVTTTDHHQFQLIALSQSNAAGGWDMVQFIPYSQNQEEPRYFRRDGSIGL